MGVLSKKEVYELLNEIDYTISASLTEGKPFSIIESMGKGIPCIHSDINGIDELISKENGILFKLISDKAYQKIRFDNNFDSINKLITHETKFNIVEALNYAYKDINLWNQMSKNAINFCDFKFTKEFCEKKKYYFLY